MCGGREHHSRRSLLPGRHSFLPRQQAFAPRLENEDSLRREPGTDCLTVEPGSREARRSPWLDILAITISLPALNDSKFQEG